MSPVARSPARASFSRRLGALVVDGVVVGGVVVLPALRSEGFIEDLIGYIGFIVELATRTEVFGVSEEAISAACAIAAAVVGVGFYFLCCGAQLGGQTVGKRLLGIRLIRTDGGVSLSVAQAAHRTGTLLAGSVVLGLGPASMLWDREGRTWHDRMTGTAVVEAKWGDPRQGTVKSLILAVLVTVFIAVMVPALLLVRRSNP